MRERGQRPTFGENPGAFGGKACGQGGRMATLISRAGQSIPLRRGAGLELSLSHQSVWRASRGGRRPMVRSVSVAAQPAHDKPWKTFRIASCRTRRAWVVCASQRLPASQLATKEVPVMTEDRNARSSSPASSDSDEGQVALHVRVRPELRKRARHAASELGMPMRTLVEEALDVALRRRGF